MGGKPLIAHTIEAARNSKIFDEIIVSTDSAKYAEIAREWGASVPFLRDAELSSDTASSWDVVKNVLMKFQEIGGTFETFALLQPTSPLRKAEDIIRGYEIMSNKDANAVVSVTEVDHSPLHCNTLPEDGSLVNFLKSDVIKMPRQSLPTFYRLNGAVYIANIDYFLSTDNIYKEKCYALTMSKENSVDIDDALDFKIAETLYSTTTQMKETK